MPIKQYRVFYDSPGQMCNRFWSYIDSVAWAIENNSKIIVLFWDKSIRDFTRLRHNQYITFPLYSKLMIRLIGESRYIQLLKRVLTNRYARMLYRLFLRNFVQALKAYDLHNNHNYYPHHLEEIRHLFLPNIEHRIDIDEAFESFHHANYTIVGIHIRRGDYKNWRKGQFYYSHEEYTGFMKQTQKALKGKEIIFYISTNENIPNSILQSQLPICNILSKSAAMDLYALSQCDLIIGPPSSFSRWASLMGHVPIYQIWDKNKQITLHSFSPLRYLDEREDGLRYI